MRYEGVKPHVRDRRTGGMTEVPNTPTKLPSQKRARRRKPIGSTERGLPNSGWSREAPELPNEASNRLGLARLLATSRRWELDPADVTRHSAPPNGERKRAEDTASYMQPSYR